MCNSLAGSSPLNELKEQTKKISNLKHNAIAKEIKI